MTPHTRGYRSGVDDTGPIPPSESINPVPIPFLAVERGFFLTHLTGPELHLTQARDLFIKAVTDLGLGAKTAAGYGYMTQVEDNEDNTDTRPSRDTRRR